MAKTDTKNIVYFALAGLTLVGAFAGSAKTYYGLQAKVERQAKDIEELKDELKDDDKEDMGLRISVTELKTQMEYIREDTGAILQYIKTLK